MTKVSDAPSGAHFVSVIFPCLNEEEAIRTCVESARAALGQAGLDGEILVVDNGSTDRSAEIAAEAGARVVHETRPGYGSAYLRGIAEARGDVIVMLDADGSYPAEEIPGFVEPIRAGAAEMVLGNRFGKKLDPGAMPWANRYIGNPVLSGMTRLLFRLPLRDMHCGMRAIGANEARGLALEAPGMEFATEMIVKVIDRGLRVHEIPITYRPRVGESKLHPLRDAWRHVEFMLVLSPSLLFIWPGLILILAGLGIQAQLLFGTSEFLGRPWNIHTMLAGVACALCGATLSTLGGVSTAFASRLGLRFRHSRTAQRLAPLGALPWRLAGTLAVLVGLASWARVFWSWYRTGFGALHAVHELAFATSLVGVGGELLLGAFVINLLSLQMPRQRTQVA